MMVAPRRPTRDEQIDRLARGSVPAPTFLALSVPFVALPDGIVSLGKPEHTSAGPSASTTEGE